MLLLETDQIVSIVPSDYPRAARSQIKSQECKTHSPAQGEIWDTPRSGERACQTHPATSDEASSSFPGLFREPVNHTLIQLLIFSKTYRILEKNRKEGDSPQ